MQPHRSVFAKLLLSVVLFHTHIHTPHGPVLCRCLCGDPPLAPPSTLEGRNVGCGLPSSMSELVNNRRVMDQDTGLLRSYEARDQTVGDTPASGLRLVMVLVGVHPAPSN